MATIGLEQTTYNFLGFKIPILELGGNEEIRNSYVLNTNQTLNGTMVLLFLFDITKTLEFNTSLSYLTDLLQKFLEIGETPHIHILLTKHDPQFHQQQKSYINHAQTRIKDLFTDLKFPKYTINKVSTINMASIVKTFSEMFRDISPQSKLIADAFKEKAESLEKKNFAGFILAENGFLISEWTNRLSTHRRDILITEASSFLAENSNEDIFQSQLEGIFLIFQKITIGSTTLFLTSINTQKSKLSDEIILRMTKTITPWVKNFFSIVNKRSLPTY